MIILDDQARQQMTRHFLIVTSMQRFAHHWLRVAMCSHAYAMCSHAYAMCSHL